MDCGRTCKLCTEREKPGYEPFLCQCVSTTHSLTIGPMCSVTILCRNKLRQYVFDEMGKSLLNEMFWLECVLKSTNNVKHS